MNAKETLVGGPFDGLEVDMQQMLDSLDLSTQSANVETFSVTMEEITPQTTQITLAIYVRSASGNLVYDHQEEIPITR